MTTPQSMKSNAFVSFLIAPDQKLMKNVYLKKQKGNQTEKIICFANQALPKEAEHRDVILPREIIPILTTAFRKDLT